MGDAWVELDAVSAAELPEGPAEGALSGRAAVLENLMDARARSGLAGFQQVALARAALEVANRATAVYLEALLGLRQVYRAEHRAAAAADVRAQLRRRAQASAEAPVDEAVVESRVEDRVDEDLVDRWTVAEAAVACGMSEYTTRANLDTALTAAQKLPGAGGAFACGELELGKLRLFADAVSGLDAEQAGQVEALVLPRAALLPPARLKAALAEAVAAVAGEQDERDARLAREERHVRVRQLSQTMAELVALLPAEDAAVVQNALVHLADAAAGPDDARTADQLRADALVDAVVDAAHDAAIIENAPTPTPSAAARGDAADAAHAADAADAADAAGAAGGGGSAGAADVPAAESGSAGTGSAGTGSVGSGSVGSGSVGSGSGGGRRRGRSGRKPRVHALVTIPMSTFLGEADEPGSLAGYGPLPAGIVRELMREATWQCAVVDDTHGTLLGLGRATWTGSYTPGRPLAEHVTARDLTCRFPGCGRQAAGCEIDHLIPHPRASTCSCNTGPLCPHHHRVKHEAGWDVERSTDPDHPPGSLIWISPTGDHHVWRAPALTPAHQYARARERDRRAAAHAAELTTRHAAAADDDEPPPF